jgi:pyruvate dehydrogenase E2 component (dihydrolipoyllysine-residue acetyltransferase)
VAHRIVMPSFGMYTAEGSLGRWLVTAGSRVEAGDPIVEITTEKASYEVEAPASGVLHPTAVEGESLTVEGLLGWILSEGETPPVDGRRGSSPASRAAGAERRAPLPQGVKASPAARRLAAERGVDLASLTGTGPGGRIVEADVLALAQTVPPAPPPPRELPWRIRERIPLAGARKTIAERLRWSFLEAIPLTLTREVRAEALAETRARIGGEVSYDALFVKILADSLRERPELNAVIREEEILLFDEIHVGFAVSLPAGLVVPVVRDADARPLTAIAADVAKLAASARAGTLRPQDVLGGTVTLSNLGGHGIDAFTPVLNPPQAAVLGIGRIAERPVVEEGRLIAGRSCVLSLTFDHRVADGAPAAELLGAIARRMTDREYLGKLARI